jgi:hypothetical protein
MRVTSRGVPDRYDSCTACLPSLHFGIPAMFQFPWRILSISGEILEPTHVTIQSSLASSESPFLVGCQMRRGPAGPLKIRKAVFRVISTLPLDYQNPAIGCMRWQSRKCLTLSNLPIGVTVAWLQRTFCLGAEKSRDARILY